MAVPVPNTAAMLRGPAPRTTAVIVVAILGFLGIATTALGSLRVVVQPGETLGGIAARHGVSVATIAGHNGIRDANRVAAGRVLEIPGGLRGGGSSATGGGTYTVRPGDTLSGIASRFGLSVGSLVRLNGLSSAHLVIAGSTLRLGGGSAPSAGSTTGGATYTVQARRQPRRDRNSLRNIHRGARERQRPGQSQRHRGGHPAARPRQHPRHRARVRSRP